MNLPKIAMTSYGKLYRMSDTKAQYLIKFSVANYLKKKLIYHVNSTPYFFLFDKTTNSQVKNSATLGQITTTK